MQDHLWRATTVRLSVLRVTDGHVYKLVSRHASLDSTSYC